MKLVRINENDSNYTTRGSQSGITKGPKNYDVPEDLSEIKSDLLTSSKRTLSRDDGYGVVKNNIIYMYTNKSHNGFDAYNFLALMKLKSVPNHYVLGTYTIWYNPRFNHPTVTDDLVFFSFDDNYDSVNLTSWVNDRYREIDTNSVNFRDIYKTITQFLSKLHDGDRGIVNKVTKEITKIMDSYE